MKIQLAPYFHLKKAAQTELDFKSQEYCRLIDQTKEFCESIEESSAQIKKNVDIKNVVVLGMGGSSLGVKAFSYLLGLKNICFLDELSDFKAEKVLSSVDFKTTVFLTISKSGNTSETLVLFDHVLNKLKDSGLEPTEHLYSLTAQKDSNALLKHSKNLGIRAFDFPEALSGRFSMFGLPGLLPLHLAGVDIEEIKKGFEKALEQVDFVKVLSGVLIHSIENKDFGQNVWTYDGRLRYFRAWLRQLISESLGKTSKTNPEYSLPPFIECRGSTDQHSYLQHVLALPKKSLNLIFEMDGENEKGSLDTRQALEAQKLKNYFSKYEIRYVEVKLESEKTSELSQLFVSWMFATQLVGDHYGLDVFKQENIDELKKMSLLEKEL